MNTAIKEVLVKCVEKIGLEIDLIKLDYPESFNNGDFTTNIALVFASKMSMKPRELAEKIVLEFNAIKPDFVEKASIAGQGFINFFIKDKTLTEFIVNNSKVINKKKKKEKQVMVEYTDPNPFKVLHIGHLMSNAIGESIARLIEYNGDTEVKRANWQGDVGPHVAKAIWGAMHLKRDDLEKPELFWGRAYVYGNNAYEAAKKEKKEIDAINMKIYDRSDEVINKLYDQGRRECLDAFEKIYSRLGTKFDNYFFESKEGRLGEDIVKEFTKKGVFEESEGAVVFKGEKYALHTRVFMTSLGLPTYETKELGLNKEKFALYPGLFESIIITGNEQADYFKVLLKVMEFIYPDIALKTKHIPHGMLRFASGKMSSRKGNVISADFLIDEIKDLVMEKIKDRNYSAKEADEISDMIAIGAIKYSILRQSIGGDVIFNSSASISFEGDSGPYLQYSAVRANSTINKASEMDIDTSIGNASIMARPEKAGTLERMLIRFEDMVQRSRDEYAPQTLANYLIDLAGLFNSFYANQVIVNKDNILTPYYVSLTKVFLEKMTKGLWILGIKVPERM